MYSIKINEIGMIKYIESSLFRLIILSLLIVITSTPAPATEAGWYNKAMRWGQVNLNERDPIEFPLQWWRDYWKRCELDGISINAGGFIAYYPSNVPNHRQARFLGDRDLFGEIVKAAKEDGLYVLARFDPCYANENFYFTHPDWFCVGVDGEPLIARRRITPRDKLYYTCINGPYFTEQMPAIIAEVAANYPIDGIFGNAWYGHEYYGTDDLCMSPYCQEAYHRDTGHNLPRTWNRKDPNFRRWITWRENQDIETWRRFTRAVQSENPNAVFIPNKWKTKGWSDLAAAGVKIFEVENQGRRVDTPLWKIGMTAKIMRSIGDESIPFFLVAGAYLPGYRHAAKPEAEQRVWLAEIMAHGGRPYFHMVGGSQRDTRMFKANEEMFRFHAANERVFRDRRSIANVALVFSPETVDWHSGGSWGGVGSDHFAGYYQALLESGIPFDVIEPAMINRALTRRYRAIVLPNAACLSDDACREIGRYIEAGGSLVWTYQTSLYDRWGDRRADFGLAGATGIHTDAAEPVTPWGMNYFRITADHPSIETLAEARLLQSRGSSWVSAEADGPWAKPLHLVPSFIPSPPALRGTDIEKVDRPLLFLKEKGRSRLAYLAADLDKRYWTGNIPDHGEVLRGLVRWAARDDNPVAVDGLGLVDIDAFTNSSRSEITVHLVNLTHADAWRAPLKELIPVGPQEVRLKLPPGRPAMTVRLLSAGTDIGYRKIEGGISFTVPDLLDYEVIVIELGGGS